MADTLKFGPEWLRQLSDGNSVASPPPTPGLGSKFKIAEYRYGREEMLALFHDNYKAPDDLVNYPPVYVEDSQKPLAFISLTEEEQRLMSQSVNSTTVLRSMGRGGQPVRGGRGGGDRGRGRGRGRGEGFPPRGGNYDLNENGGYGRSRGQNADGWEEVGKKYDRSFSNRNHEDVPRHPQFSRSLSSDNWREKDEQNTEEDGGDWRRAGPQKDRWGTRGSWREPLGRGGFDGERRSNGPVKDRTRNDDRVDDRHHVYRRSRSSESWDTDDLPEWSVPGDDDIEELGTFDSSGAFVTSHPKGLKNGESQNSSAPTSQSDAVVGKDTVPREQRKERKLPRPTSAPDVKQTTSNQGNSHSNSPHTVRPDQEHIRSAASKSVQFGDISQVTNNSNSTHINNNKQDSSPDPNLHSDKKVKDTMPAAESEAFSRLKEAAENMVAEMTAEDDEHRTAQVREVQGQSVPVNHEDSLKWFYKDPQGDVQGPFNPEEMAQWFSAGYFTMSLLVKRGCDERFQQLGELIKRWGRVPFLAGPVPPPLLNIPVTNSNSEAPSVKSAVQQQPPPQQPTPPPQDLMGMIPQQFLIQQLMQQQLLMRNMQVQMMAQLQEQESFKSLSPPQQQQLVMQMLMQTQPVFMQQMQQLQQLQQQQQQQQQNRLSPQPQSEVPSVSHAAYARSVSQPVPTEAEGPPQVTPGSWSQPTSVWELEAADLSPNTVTQQQREKLQAQQNAAEEARRKQEEEERLKQLEIQRTQEELKRQQEELAREREKMMREMEELERQREIELKRLEEIHRQEEEQRRRQLEEERKREEARRREEQRRREEELALQRVEEARRKEQEEQRRVEEERRRRDEMQKKQMEEEQRNQEMLRQQEIQRNQEEMKIQQQQEEERQRELLRQQELQRQEQQRQQQQEALRRLQQQQREQLARMQLPATAQWASQSNQRDSNEGKSLAEIQQEEERQSQERERQLEFQRQQMLALQQQQQQQMQKSWGSQITVNQAATNTLKSLLDIQEEQAKDQGKKQKTAQQSKPKAAPAATLSTPSMWSNVASNGAQSAGWGGNTVWGADKSSGGVGFWDEAVITSKKAATKDTGEFPALGGKKRNQQTNNNSTMSSAASNRNKQAKPKKEEQDTVQKLFQTSRQVDDFTQWCENSLSGLAAHVDVPTFIGFLQEVESPYEVHDYVRSYLGESGAAKEFGRQFLEKRSQYKQKARLEKQQEEDSIWGPAPAVNPKESRSSNNNDFEFSSVRNKNKKKKGKMQKVDKSILGFTVHADPTRVNAGEIDNLD